MLPTCCSIATKIYAVTVRVLFIIAVGLAPTAMAATTAGTIADLARRTLAAIPLDQVTDSDVIAAGSSLVAAGRCQEADDLFTSFKTGEASRARTRLPADIARELGDQACAARMAVLDIDRRSRLQSEAPFQHAREIVLAGAILRITGQEQAGKALIDRGYALLAEGAPADVVRWEPLRQKEFWLARRTEVRRYQGTPLAMPTAERYARELAAQPLWAQQEERSDFVTVLALLDRRDLADPLLLTMPDRGDWQDAEERARLGMIAADPCANSTPQTPRPALVIPTEADVAKIMNVENLSTRLVGLWRLAFEAAVARRCSTG